MGKAKKIRWSIYEVIMVVLAIIFIFPAWIVLTNSFKPLGDILADTFGFPKSVFLDNFTYVLENMNYPRIFLNTVIICVCAISVTVVLSAMCAYRLSRWNNKISRIILLVLMASMTVPFQSIMLPLSWYRCIARWQYSFIRGLSLQFHTRLKRRRRLTDVPGYRLFSGSYFRF